MYTYKVKCTVPPPFQSDVASLAFLHKLPPEMDEINKLNSLHAG